MRKALIVEGVRTGGAKTYNDADEKRWTLGYKRCSEDRVLDINTLIIELLQVLPSQFAVLPIQVSPPSRFWPPLLTMASFYVYDKALVIPPFKPHEVLPVSLFHTIRPVFVVGAALLLPFIFNYAFAWATYHWQHKATGNHRLPPEYPTFIPYLGGLVPLLIDGQGFLNRAT
jgi:hypothetical protein